MGRRAEGDNCGNCDFVLKMKPRDVIGGPTLLYCRRFPPTVLPTEQGPAAFFAMVDETVWCGEYEQQT